MPKPSRWSRGKREAAEGEERAEGSQPPATSSSLPSSQLETPPSAAEPRRRLRPPLPLPPPHPVVEGRGDDDGDEDAATQPTQKPNLRPRHAKRHKRWGEAHPTRGFDEPVGGGGGLSPSSAATPLTATGSSAAVFLSFAERTQRGEEEEATARSRRCHRRRKDSSTQEAQSASASPPTQSGAPTSATIPSTGRRRESEPLPRYEMPPQYVTEGSAPPHGPGPRRRPRRAPAATAAATQGEMGGASSGRGSGLYESSEARSGTLPSSSARSLHGSGVLGRHHRAMSHASDEEEEDEEQSAGATGGHWSGSSGTTLRRSLQHRPQPYRSARSPVYDCNLSQSSTTFPSTSSLGRRAVRRGGRGEDVDGGRQRGREIGGSEGERSTPQLVEVIGEDEEEEEEGESSQQQALQRRRRRRQRRPQDVAASSVTSIVGANVSTTSGRHSSHATTPLHGPHRPPSFSASTSSVPFSGSGGSPHQRHRHTHGSHQTSPLSLPRRPPSSLTGGGAGARGDGSVVAPPARLPPGGAAASDAATGAAARSTPGAQAHSHSPREGSSAGGQHVSSKLRRATGRPSVGDAAASAGAGEAGSGAHRWTSTSATHSRSGRGSKVPSSHSGDGVSGGGGDGKKPGESSSRDVSLSSGGGGHRSSGSSSSRGLRSPLLPRPPTSRHTGSASSSAHAEPAEPLWHAFTRTWHLQSTLSTTLAVLFHTLHLLLIVSFFSSPLLLRSTVFSAPTMARPLLQAEGLISPPPTSRNGGGGGRGAPPPTLSPMGVTQPPSALSQAAVWVESIWAIHDASFFTEPGHVVVDAPIADSFTPLHDSGGGNGGRHRNSGKGSGNPSGGKKSRGSGKGGGASSGSSRSTGVPSPTPEKPTEQPAPPRSSSESRGGWTGEEGGSYRAASDSAETADDVAHHTYVTKGTSTPQTGESAQARNRKAQDEQPNAAITPRRATTAALGSDQREKADGSLTVVNVPVSDLASPPPRPQRSQQSRRKRTSNDISLGRIAASWEASPLYSSPLALALYYYVYLIAAVLLLLLGTRGQLTGHFAIVRLVICAGELVWYVHHGVHSFLVYAWLLLLSHWGWFFMEVSPTAQALPRATPYATVGRRTGTVQFNWYYRPADARDGMHGTPLVVGQLDMSEYLYNQVYVFKPAALLAAVSFLVVIVACTVRDTHRVLDALMGVRQLWEPEGCTRCPLCGEVMEVHQSSSSSTQRLAGSPAAAAAAAMPALRFWSKRKRHLKKRQRLQREALRTLQQHQRMHGSRSTYAAAPFLAPSLNTSTSSYGGIGRASSSSFLSKVYHGCCCCGRGASHGSDGAAASLASASGYMPLSPSLLMHQEPHVMEDGEVVFLPTEAAPELVNTLQDVDAVNAFYVDVDSSSGAEDDEEEAREADDNCCCVTVRRLVRRRRHKHRKAHHNRRRRHHSTSRDGGGGGTSGTAFEDEDEENSEDDDEEEESEENASDRDASDSSEEDENETGLVRVIVPSSSPLTLNSPSVQQQQQQQPRGLGTSPTSANTTSPVGSTVPSTVVVVGEGEGGARPGADGVSSSLSTTHHPQSAAEDGPATGLSPLGSATAVFEEAVAKAAASGRNAAASAPSSVPRRSSPTVDVDSTAATAAAGPGEVTSGGGGSGSPAGGLPQDTVPRAGEDGTAAAGEPSATAVVEPATTAVGVLQRKAAQKKPKRLTAWELQKQYFSHATRHVHHRCPKLYLNTKTTNDTSSDDDTSSSSSSTSSDDAKHKKRGAHKKKSKKKGKHATRKGGEEGPSSETSSDTTSGPSSISSSSSSSSSTSSMTSPSETESTDSEVAQHDITGGRSCSPRRRVPKDASGLPQYPTSRHQQELPSGALPTARGNAAAPDDGSGDESGSGRNARQPRRVRFLAGGAVVPGGVRTSSGGRPILGHPPPLPQSRGGRGATSAQELNYSFAPQAMMGYGTMNDRTDVDHVVTRAVYDPFKEDEDEFRPGNAFPSYEKAGWFSRQTYTWMNPLLTFALLEPTLLRSEQFLPSLPPSMTSLDNVGVPTWRLWVNRKVWYGAMVSKPGDLIPTEETLDEAEAVLQLSNARISGLRARGGSRTSRTGDGIGDNDDEEDEEDDSQSSDNQTVVVLGQKPLKRAKLRAQRPRRAWEEQVFLFVTTPFRVLFSKMFYNFYIRGSHTIQRAHRRLVQALLRDRYAAAATSGRTEGSLSGLTLQHAVALAEMDATSNGSGGSADGNGSAGSVLPTHMRRQLAQSDVSLFNLFLEHRSGRRFVYSAGPQLLLSNLLSLSVIPILAGLIAAVERRSSATSTSSGSSSGPAQTSVTSVEPGLYWCLTLFVVLFVQSFVHQEHRRRVCEAALEAKTAIQTLVLEKVLTLPLAQRTFSEEEMVSLITVEANRCRDALSALHYSWSYPLLIVATVLFLWYYLNGMAALVTLLGVICMVPLMRHCSAQVRLNEHNRPRSTMRVGLLTEAVAHMRQVKATLMEGLFSHHIFSAYEEENRGERRITRAETWASVSREGGVAVLLTLCIGAFYLAGGALDSVAAVVPALAALSLLWTPLMDFPPVCSSIARGYLSMKRLEAFLRQSPDEFVGTWVDLTLLAEFGGFHYRRGAVFCHGCSFTWQHDLTEEPPQPLLTDVNMSVMPGELVVLQGPLGGGKSTLLLAVLGEVNRCVDVAAGHGLGNSMTTATAETAEHLSSAGDTERHEDSENSLVTSQMTSVVLLAQDPRLLPGAPGMSSRPSLTDLTRSAFHISPNTRSTPTAQQMVAPFSTVTQGGTTTATSSSTAGAAANEANPTPSVEVPVQKTDGFLVFGSCAYCPEDPWLQNDTVRANITAGGNPSQKHWYHTVVRACALVQDLRTLPKGDETVIGEGGVPLTRSQKVRIGLARAVFSKADIYLLDSPLTALNPPTRAHVVREVFHKLLRNKTVLVATNVELAALQPHRIFTVLEGGVVREDTALYKAIGSDSESEGADGDTGFLEPETSALSGAGASLSRDERGTTKGEHGKDEDTPPQLLPNLYAEEYEEAVEVNDDPLEAAERRVAAAAAAAAENSDTDTFDIDSEGRVVRVSRGRASAGMRDREGRGTGDDAGRAVDADIAAFGGASFFDFDEVDHLPAGAGGGGGGGGGNSDGDGNGVGVDEEYAAEVGLPTFSAAMAEEIGAEVPSELDDESSGGRGGRRGGRSDDSDEDGDGGYGRGAGRHRSDTEDGTGGGNTTIAVSVSSTESRSSTSDRDSRGGRRSNRSDDSARSDEGGAKGSDEDDDDTENDDDDGAADGATGAGGGARGRRRRRGVRDSRLKVRRIGRLEDGSRVTQQFVAFMGVNTYWVILTAVVQQCLRAGMELWLALWLTLSASVSTSWWGHATSFTCIAVLAMLAIATTIMVYVRSRTFMCVVYGTVHNVVCAAVERVFRAPVAYFDLGPTIRAITNIFEKDLEVTERATPRTAEILLGCLTQLGVVVVVNTAVNPAALLLLPIVVSLFTSVTLRFAVLTRELRRLEARSTAATVSLLKEAAEGAVVVRCLALQDRTREEYCRSLDTTNSAAMLVYMAERWVGLRLQFLTVILATSTAVLGVLFATTWVTPGFTAVAVIMCWRTSPILTTLCRRLSIFQLQAGSVRRLLELLRIPVEPLTLRGRSTLRRYRDMVTPTVGRDIGQPPPTLEFVSVSVRYLRSLPYALENVSLTITPRERVAFVGKSGHGKSTIFNVLLRLVAVVDGDGIVIGGEDTDRVPYPVLRSWFAVVPQDPLQLSGSWRSALVAQYHSLPGQASFLVGGQAPPSSSSLEELRLPTDAALWAALRAVGLDYVAEFDGGLDAPVAGGELVEVGLSASQRRLLCLARAVLHRTPYVLLEDVASGTDARTDAVIQRVLTHELRDCTLLIIAHRLSPALALCSRYVVIESGTVSQVIANPFFEANVAASAATLAEWPASSDGAVTPPARAIPLDKAMAETLSAFIE